MNKVYYARAREADGTDSLAKKTIKILEGIPAVSSIKNNDIIGIKTHFGEKGNKGHIRPDIIKHVAAFLKKKSRRVFVFDTNTLYAGSRSNSVEHIELAYSHNFGFSEIGIPVIIADGLTGRNFAAVSVPGKHLKSVKIAADITNCDFLLCLSHMTGHMQAGFGAAIKNLGMGCASRAGKLEQHSNVLPSVTPDKCRACGACVKWCPAGAIKIEGPRAVISRRKCIGCGECTVVCKNGAIEIKWNEGIRGLQEKMAEYALGAVRAVGCDRVCFVNFLTHITKDCDCMSKDEPAICEDAGITASTDPVALDKASVDIIKEANKKDIFKIGYPEIDWSPQIKHGEAVGLGKTAYELEDVE